MSSIFDGMATALSATFGAVVTHRPTGGVAREIVAILRVDPLEEPDDDGRVMLVDSPILRAHRADAEDIARGDQIEGADGVKYRVKNRVVSGSPAADAFVIFQLETEI